MQINVIENIGLNIESTINEDIINDQLWLYR